MDIQTALGIISPFDVISITLEEKIIISKSPPEGFNPISVLVEKAEKFVMLGSQSTRNPTYWNCTFGKTKDEVPEWKELLENEIAASESFDVNVINMDNNSNVMEISGEIFLLAINCKELTKELVKEIKCAKVHTVFGPIDLTV